jgi:hypothetical protein
LRAQLGALDGRIYTAKALDACEQVGLRLASLDALHPTDEVFRRLRLLATDHLAAHMSRVGHGAGPSGRRRLPIRSSTRSAATSSC